MPAQWILVRIGRDLDTTRLMYAILEIGRTVRVTDFDEFSAELQQPSDDRSCVVVFGGIVTTTEVANHRKWIPGSWHQPELYTCRNYYSAWGKYLTQKHYCMVPAGELIRRHAELYDRYGSNDSLFIRPDESEKIFDGKVVKHEHFQGWHTTFLARVPSETLCIVSSPVPIQAEYRLVIRRNQVVTGSLYRLDGSIELEPLETRPEREDAIRFAEMVANDDPPPNLPPVYLMDLARAPSGEFSVLEVQSINAAGLYRCDLTKLVLAVSEEAESQWQRETGATTEGN
jgi:hypothetical protein